MLLTSTGLLAVTDGNYNIVIIIVAILAGIALLMYILGRRG